MKHCVHHIKDGMVPAGRYGSWARTSFFLWHEAQQKFFFSFTSDINCTLIIARVMLIDVVLYRTNLKQHLLFTVSYCRCHQSWILSCAQLIISFSFSVPTRFVNRFQNRSPFILKYCKQPWFLNKCDDVIVFDYCRIVTLGSIRTRPVITSPSRGPRCFWFGWWRWRTLTCFASFHLFRDVIGQ